MSEPGWYPVALAADAAAGTAFGTRLFGQELVVWRDEAGQAHVWEDRCPHRGMRLSFGFVRGDRLACLYHGWAFDGAARCRHIPSHPALKVPGTIRAAPFPAAERMGVLWAHAGGTPTGDPPGPDAAATPVRSLALRAPAGAAWAALGPGQRSGALLQLQLGADVVAAAVQPLSPTESCIHLVLPGGGAAAAVSDWAEALRRRVEAAA